jgi:hypothetical protein
MPHKDTKKHSDTTSDPERVQHGKTQGVTTNPENVGAGGGSTPAGHANQDSRTWGAHDNQKNTPRGTPQEARAREADAGVADEQIGESDKDARPSKAGSHTRRH